MPLNRLSHKENEGRILGRGVVSVGETVREARPQGAEVS